MLLVIAALQVTLALGPLVYLKLVIPYVSIQLLTAWSPWTSDSRHKSEKWYFLQIFFQNQVKEYFWSFCIVLRWTESDLNLELSERRAEFPWDVSGRSHRVRSSLLWPWHVWHLWILWLSWQCDHLWHLPHTGLTLDYCSLLYLLLLQGSGQLKHAAARKMMMNNSIKIFTFSENQTL